MFVRVKEAVGKDWLPTPVRAVAQVMLLLKKGGEEAVVEAFGEGADGLEGNVEGFRGEREVWADFQLQATAAVAYAGLGEGEEVIKKAMEVLCKVSFLSWDWLWGPGG
jgi:SET and MYND domain-containing protein